MDSVRQHGRRLATMLLLLCMLVATPSAASLAASASRLLAGSNPGSCTMGCADTGACCCKPSSRRPARDDVVVDHGSAIRAFVRGCPSSCAVLASGTAKASPKSVLVDGLGHAPFETRSSLLQSSASLRRTADVRGVRSRAPPARSIALHDHT
jgi:hypothetical protein